MAWELLFKSDYGLFSVFVIVATTGLAVWYARYFVKKMHEEEGQKK